MVLPIVHLNNAAFPPARQ